MRTAVSSPSHGMRWHMPMLHVGVVTGRRRRIMVLGLLLLLLLLLLLSPTTAAASACRSCGGTVRMTALATVVAHCYRY